MNKPDSSRNGSLRTTAEMVERSTSAAASTNQACTRLNSLAEALQTVFSHFQIG